MAVFQTYSAPLDRYLRRRLGSAQQAQDIGQETYLRFHQVDGVELVRAPQAYLFQIASNLIFEQRLRASRDVVTYDSRVVEAVAKQVSDPCAVEPSRQLGIEQELQSILERLPPMYAAILLLKKHAGKSVEEISHELNISTHTVKKYLFRALRTLRESYQGERHE